MSGLCKAELHPTLFFNLDLNLNLDLDLCLYLNLNLDLCLQFGPSKYLSLFVRK